jgi:multicomponent Na+:H+ antiporter subunit B
MTLKQNQYSGFLFIAGLAVFMGALLVHIPYANLLSAVGMEILADSPETLPSKPNVVGAILYHYRGLDTLGEITVLFVALTAAGLILGAPRTPNFRASSIGFILHTAADLLFPLLVLFGFYIIIYGDVIPGGLFQGGALLATAFFIPLLASPNSPVQDKIAPVETLVGSIFLLLGLASLLTKGEFLNYIFGYSFGHFMWDNILIILHFIIALKIGIALSSLLARFVETDN